MSFAYLRRSSVAVLIFALAVAACSGNSSRNGPDAPPDVNRGIDGGDADDASIVAPDGSGLDASNESQGEVALASPVTVSPASIDFGSIPPAVRSPGRTITITATTNIFDLTVSSLGGDLTIDKTSTCGRTLAAGGSCALVISFFSGTVGAKSESITITAAGQSVVVPVTAKVQTDSHLLIAPATPQTFTAPPGGTSAAITFKIGNPSNTDIGPIAIEITGANAAEFSVVATTCNTLAPLTDCTISVVFAPPAGDCSPAASTASLNVLAPGSDGRLAATVALTGGGPTPNPFMLTPATSDLGSVVVGTTGPPIAFALTYSGDVCSGASTAGPFTVELSNAEFIVTSETCSTSLLAAGQACTISVALQPTSAGLKTAVFLVTTPTGDARAAKSLTGTGLPAMVDGGIDSNFDGATIDQSESFDAPAHH